MLKKLCIKFQLLVIFSSLFTDSSITPALLRSYCTNFGFFTTKVYEFWIYLWNCTNIGTSRDVPDVPRRTSVAVTHPSKGERVSLELANWRFTEYWYYITYMISHEIDLAFRSEKVVLHDLSTSDLIFKK